MFRWFACLFGAFSFFFLNIFCDAEFHNKYCRCSETQSLPHLSDPQSTCLTHTCPQQTKLHPPLSFHTALSPVSSRLLTVSLVLLQSRKASEQAKSVDSKTDSIGSGRAIPIKQVSTFTDPLTFISKKKSPGKYELFVSDSTFFYF